ncbi:nucleoside diphosphate-linked moiety X motif 19-like isoform X2 [Sinocyclocheilus grahami]|uniref:nucleoside diphosphate-linked moiety X motif 19-like isoform X2 n=1 Tax=Sinocyclocheilus grahami TaxID=75366 RepID=UPI0007ACB7CC|nr:PREDICTED: nucleoside diphosphate-linked moiety X motif 19-like isoform X2 [Sinocyclocheilus grahami]
MNTALKHWREAATVILAAGLRHAQSADSLKTGLEKATHIAHRSAFDYQVLLLKRSENSGFMPNAYVFPGGLADASDFSSDWQEVFRSFTKAPHYGIGVAKQPPETRPPIFATDRAQLGSPIPGDVAFRICAVRETFEESGVLLAVPKHEESGIRVHTEDTQPTLTTLSGLWDRDVLSKWRSLVIGNSANFIKMCKELQCLPNIWALHEWGNWLTPLGMHGNQRRYDTAFYICCLRDTPHTLHDEKEIVHFKVRFEHGPVPLRCCTAINQRRSGSLHLSSTSLDECAGFQLSEISTALPGRGLWMVANSGCLFSWWRPTALQAFYQGMLCTRKKWTLLEGVVV